MRHLKSFCTKKKFPSAQQTWLLFFFRVENYFFFNNFKNILVNWVFLFLISTETFSPPLLFVRKKIRRNPHATFSEIFLAISRFKILVEQQITQRSLHEEFTYSLRPVYQAQMISNEKHIKWHFLNCFFVSTTSSIGLFESLDVLKPTRLI